MKKTMILYSLLLLAAVIPAAAAEDRDRPVRVEDIPSMARTFISEYFPDRDVAIAKVEKEFFETNYEVILRDGTELEFDRRGKWTKVACRYSPMPDILDDSVKARINEIFPEKKVTAVERSGRKIEVKLDNGFELIFDMAGNLIEIDD